jgi:cation diffusion facilitator CzcD-associated flavoprotein CzcO
MDQHVYTKDEINEFIQRPEVLREVRKANESGLNSMFGLYLQNTTIQNEMKVNMRTQMEEKLKDKFLEEKLIPSWGVGCRRLTPGINYLESLHKENVKVVYGEINEITERGCKCDDGKEYPVDVLICATGFDTSFRPRFPLIGPGGHNLQDVWSKEPKSYLGIAAPGFPNYFIFLGPNCPIGNGPVLSAIECQADYMLTLVDRWQTENIKSLTPKMEAVDEFLEHTDQFMRKTIWNQECRSWYKNGSISGRVSALWPGSTLHYIEMMQSTRFDDWDIKYDGNRFAFMGNG